MTDLVIILRIKGGRSHRWSFTGCSSRRQAQLQSISLINGLMNRARSCDLTVLQPENTNTQPQGRRGRNQRGRDVQPSYTTHPSNTLFCILHLQRAPSRLVLIIIMNVWSLEVVRYIICERIYSINLAKDSSRTTTNLHFHQGFPLSAPPFFSSSHSLSRLHCACSAR